jgi:hypothetical protein
VSAQEMTLSNQLPTKPQEEVKLGERSRRGRSQWAYSIMTERVGGTERIISAERITTDGVALSGHDRRPRPFDEANIESG